MSTSISLLYIYCALHRWTLAHKVVWPFTLITVSGSIVLLILFHLYLSAQADRNLKARVETNADFLRSTDFPPSTLLADNLGRMLQLRIAFRWEGRLITDGQPLSKELTSSAAGLPADGVVRPAPESFRALAISVDDQLDLIALQPAETMATYFRRKNAPVSGESAPMRPDMAKKRKMN